MSIPVFVGVDPSREIFEFEISGEQFALLNVPESFPRLTEELQKLGPSAHVICKGDGRWESGVVDALQRHGIPVSLIPVQVLCAFGGLASPEDIDTSLLVRYGQAHASSLQNAEIVPYIRRAVSVIAPSFLERIHEWIRGRGTARNQTQRSHLRAQTATPRKV